MNFSKLLLKPNHPLAEFGASLEAARSRGLLNAHSEQTTGTDGSSAENLAEQNYLKGLGFVQESEQQGFKNPQVLFQAYRHFQVAFRKNNADPRYPCAMAYLLILLQQFDRALGYLTLALNQDPEYERALKLKQIIDNLKNNPEGVIKKQRWKLFSEWPKPQSDQEFDELYDQVEAFIAEETRFILQSKRTQSLSLDKEIQQDQQAFLAELRLFLYLVHQKLKVLEENIETQALEMALRPAQQMLKRLQTTLEHAEEMQFLRTEIQLAQAEVHRLFAELKTPKANPEESADFSEEMERLYDICDSLADDLDELSKHADIAPLEAAYQHLIENVQRLQEYLDSEG